MIVCPNPDCGYDLETFEVETRYGVTGARLYVTCEECERCFEVQVFTLGLVDADA